MDWSVKTIWSLYEMMELGAAYVVTAIQLLEQAERELHANVANESNTPVYLGLVNQIDETCIKMGFTLSSQQASRVRDRLSGKQDHWSHLSLRDEFFSLKRTITDELKGRRLFYITPDEASLYNRQLPIDANGKLSNAADDIVEAGKCLALGRNTASVFHLMRAMEIGAQQFGVSTGAFTALPVDKEWGKITRSVHMQLFPTPPAAATSAQKTLQEKYSDALVRFDAVRVACRNPTMHPKASYGQEDARAIYEATLAFLVVLEKVL